jgi:hypothetical protein
MLRCLTFALFNLIIIGLPTHASAQAAQVDWKRYDHLDPDKIVPTAPLKRVLEYYDSVRNQLKNPDFITVVDFTQHNTKKRFYLIDMRTGLVNAYLVAHGIGSDPMQTGYARIFSNRIGSNMSSLGISITQETYIGKWGYSLRLHGLEKTNSRLRERDIVIHWADYVNPTLNPIGMSEGCLVLEQHVSREIIDKIANGSLIISWIDPTVPHQNL